MRPICTRVFVDARRRSGNPNGFARRPSQFSINYINDLHISARDAEFLEISEHEFPGSDRNVLNEMDLQYYRIRMTYITPSII